MLQKEANYLKMEVLTLFLLIGTLTVEASRTGEIIKTVNKFLENRNRLPINNHSLEFDKFLGKSNNVAVWKALFDGEEVAIKISWNEDYIKRETYAYEALDAFNERNILNEGIPMLYHSGKIFDKYWTIVMTLFDGTLRDRCKAQKCSLTAYSTLQVFWQSINTIARINAKDIVHNGIEPGNIFFRHYKVFIGGFDAATKKGESSRMGGHPKYYPSRYWKDSKLPRVPMDDLESLVYTIWEIENISTNGSRDGALIARQSEIENVHLMKEKCKHFANFPESQEACEFISINEMLSGQEEPDYCQIGPILQAAIWEVIEKTGQKRFEWNESPPSGVQLKFGVHKDN